jgi:hypothetical protein
MANYKTELSLCVDSCNCGKLTITDESIIPNDSVGHAVFGYRKIIVQTPNNTYTYSSLTADNADQSISVLSANGVNNFNYNFQDSDTDGIYSVTLYNFPAWNDSVLYSKQSKPIVFLNGILYRCVESNTGVDPSTDTNNDFWEVYTIGDNTLKTRYARNSKSVVLCISLLACHDRTVSEAFCGDVGCGENICENSDFQKAMKLSLLRKAICIAEENKDWAEVERLVEIFKNLCCASCC